jgi:hypothetical protein
MVVVDGFSRYRIYVGTSCTLGLYPKLNWVSSAPDFSFAPFGSELKWFCHTEEELSTNFVQQIFSFSGPEYLDHLPAITKDRIVNILIIADAGFKNGRVAATSKTREVHWRNWTSHFQAVGMDPYLQGSSFNNNEKIMGRCHADNVLLSATNWRNDNEEFACKSDGQENSTV